MKAINASKLNTLAAKVFLAVRFFMALLARIFEDAEDFCRHAGCVAPEIITLP